MGQRILVALDDSDNAFRAVEFVAGSFTTDHEITLFSVLLDAEGLCKLQGPEMSPYFLSYKAAFCAMEDMKKELVTKTQQRAKEILLKAGFPDRNIVARVQSLKNGVARDIVEEARAGYQVIVMGRRGHSGITEFLLGSVSQKVLHSCKDANILIVT
jgi:nucleotide-binding universal stress UspA family protein